MAWGFVLLAASGCIIGRPSRKAPALADEWELAGPFKIFSTKKKSKPAASKPPARHPTPSSAPTSQPWDLDLETRSRRFDDSFDLDRVPPGLFASLPHEDDTYWYLDFGYRTGYIRINEAKQQLDRRMALPLKLDVFGVFRRPTTPLDRKSNFSLTTQYIGLGRRETDWLTWNFYVGGAAGKDRTSQRWLNANLEVEFDYALIYTGLTTDLYPWGVPKYRNYPNYKERLKASRPYAVTGFEIGFLRAGGKGHFNLAPVRIYDDSQKIEDWLFAWLIGMGWEFPINDRWAFNFSWHYTFHFYRPTEYNGWNTVLALRYRF